MAGPRASTGWLVAVVAAMTLLVTTGLWNPFPDIWTWLTTSRPLADPPLVWQERLGGVPKSITILDRFVVVEQRESVEVRGRENGRRIWEAKSDWATVAGTPDRTLVISGTLLKKGYEIREAGTGILLRRNESASAVWSFTNALLDVSCGTPRDCELTAWDPVTGQTMWRAGLPGIGFVLFADNPKLAMGATMAPDRINVLTGPQWMPRFLGFPIDSRIHVVDTNNGNVLPAIEPDKHTSVTVLGGRIVYSIAKPSDGSCRLTLIGRDGPSGAEVWRKEGYQLRTISGAGCEQRREPVAGGNAVVAVRPDGREALLDANDGREVLTAEVNEKIVATDGIHAAVRGADGASMTVYAVGRPDPLWTRRITAKATVAMTRTAVIVSDRGPDRITILDPGSGDPLKEIRSGANVVAWDGRALLLGDRRDLGYLPYAQ